MAGHFLRMFVCTYVRAYVSLARLCVFYICEYIFKFLTPELRTGRMRTYGRVGVKKDVGTFKYPYGCIY